MPNVYRTARGVQVDIDQLRLANETAIAVGNQRINARGDRLDENGNIIKTKDDVMAEHYKGRVRTTPPKDQPILDSSSEAKRVKTAEADVIDAQKLQETIASLTKQLAAKDAEVKTLKQSAPVEKEAVAEEQPIEFKEPEVQAAPEAKTAAPVRGGLANAIQKNLEYQEKKKQNKRI